MTIKHTRKWPVSQRALKFLIRPDIMIIHYDYDASRSAQSISDLLLTTYMMNLEHEQGNCAFLEWPMDSQFWTDSVILLWKMLRCLKTWTSVGHLCISWKSQYFIIWNQNPKICLKWQLLIQFNAKVSILKYSFSAQIYT